MRITRIIDREIEIDSTNPSQYRVVIEDDKGVCVFNQLLAGDDKIDISGFSNTNDGKRFSVTITDTKSGVSDKVKFTAGFEWRLSAPAAPHHRTIRSTGKIMKGLKDYRLLVSLICLILAILCFSLVPWKSTWNYVFNSSSPENKQKTEVVRKNVGGVKTIPKESVPLPTVVSVSENPPVIHQVIKTTNTVNSGSNLTVTNLIGLFPGGLSISSTGSSNTIIIVGRDLKVGGNEPSQVKWPSGIKPTRTILLTPDERKKVGENDDRIIDLQPHEDILLIIPENWNVKTFPSRDFLPSQYDSAVDENTESSGQLQVGHTIRYRNKTDETKKLGVRCTKLKDLVGFWGDNK